MAAAARAKDRATRCNPVRSGVQDLQHAGPHEPGLLLLGAGANPLPGQHKRGEHNPSIDASQTIAAIDQLFHRDFEIAYDRNSPDSSTMKTRVFSGMQPTGNLHIGNYLGALKNWVRIQNDYECIFCIVDLHAVTLFQEPAELRAKILEIAALYLAAGIDPKVCSIMVQSSVAAHAELAWMLTCVTPVGWLERMTQYKAKAAKQESVGDGLLQYPVL